MLRVLSTQKYRDDIYLVWFDGEEAFKEWTAADLVKIDAKRTTWTEYARHLDGTTSKLRFRVFKRRLQEWV